MEKVETAQRKKMKNEDTPLTRGNFDFRRVSQDSCNQYKQTNNV